jgi:NADPH-dependent F420 reductase
MNKRTIAVIGGTGDQGFGLVLRLAKAGETIVIGSRSLEKAEAAAKNANQLLRSSTVTGLENPKAASTADIVIMSVPFAAHVDMVKSIRDSIRPETIFVDVVVPLSTAVAGSSSTILSVWEGSAAQQAARLLPNNTKIASAFHNVVAESLQDLSRNVDCDIIVCSDLQETRREVMDLANKIPGARAIDGGRLENSRIVEQLTALLIGINVRYKTKSSGIRITGIQPAIS